MKEKINKLLSKECKEKKIKPESTNTCTNTIFCG